MPLPLSLARSRLPVRSALITVSLALVIVLRNLFRKKPLYATLFGDPAKAARRIRSLNDHYDFDEYDVIIVGGGSAGCVIAARLSEDPNIRVLLLEAGASSIKHPDVIVPASYAKIFRTKAEWALYTVPQTNADGLPRYWPRAKLLGGCTCMNAMIFQCGAPDDYDEWACIQKGQKGASEWSYNDFHPYFLKFETYNPTPKHPDVKLEHRGQRGPIQTGQFAYTAESTSRFVDACVEIGIPRNSDMNTPAGTMGAMRVLTYMTPKGRRATAQFAYLTEEVLARPNLTVITHAHVARILFDKSGPVNRAVGVEFTHQSDTFQVKARKEVVVSAGAIHTPHILMLSGIGPADHLAEHKIPVVADLPGVGSHLMDHAVVDLNFLDKTKTGLGFLRAATPLHALRLIKALLQWTIASGGPLTTNVAEGTSFLRSTDTLLFPPSEYPPEEIEDTTSGPGAPDLEFLSSPFGYLKHGAVQMPTDPMFSMHAVLLRPKSLGTIRLKSNNPNDAPEVDPKYLSHPNDMAVIKRGVRLLARLMHTKPIASMIDHAGDNYKILDHHFHRLDDAGLVDLIKRRIESLYHPACTARMAPLGDGGVVDPYLRVYGIPNLRVADASVFPTLVSGHTTAPTLAVAEKVSDMIKAALSPQANICI